jgi:hypothetical protein
VGDRVPKIAVVGLQDVRHHQTVARVGGHACLQRPQRTGPGRSGEGERIGREATERRDRGSGSSAIRACNSSAEYGNVSSTKPEVM